MRKFLALMAVTAVFLGACSNESDGGGESSSEDPKAALTAAFEEFKPGEPTSLTVSLISTPESLAALPDAPSEEQSNLVLNSSITIEGNGAETIDEAQTRIAFNVEGTEGAEVLVLGGDLFVRADVEGLAEAFGADPASIQSGAAAAKKQGVTFVEPLLQGEFIKFTGLQELAEGQMGGDLDSLAAQQQKLADQLFGALEEDAEVTFEGSDDVGDHYVATTAVRDLYETFTEFAAESGQAIPPGVLPPSSEIPEGDLSLDLWLEDDRLVQMEFDLLQVAELTDDAEKVDGVEELGVRFVFSEDFEEISEPEVAEEVTAEEIQGLIGSFLFGGMPGAVPPGGGEVPGGGGGGGGGAGGDPCSIYEGLPPETFEGLPQDTLDLLEQQCPGIVP